MAKKKSKKTQSSQKTGVVKLSYPIPDRDARSQVRTTISTSDHERVCAMTNPFCSMAKGSRIPDGNNASSVAFQLRSVHTFSLDGNGNKTILIQPNPKFCFLDSATTPASAFQVTTWNGASWQGVSGVSALQNNFSKYRLVSWGVHVMSTAKVTDKAGVIRMITVGANDSAIHDYSGGFFEEVQDFPANTDNLYWIGKPKGVTWTEYVDAPSTTATASYNHLVVSMFGGASVSNALTLEIVFNIEAQVDPANSMAITARPSEPARDHTIKAAGHVRSKHNSAVSPSFLSRLGDLAREGLAQVASYAIPYVGNLVGDLVRPRRRPKYLRDYGYGGSVLEVD